MRVLFVWFTAITCLFVITIGWYLGNGIVVTLAHEALSGVTGQAYGELTLLEFVASWWGPLLDAIVLLWAFINSQEDDPIGLYR